MFFLSFFDICQIRADFQRVKGKDFFEKFAAAALPPHRHGCQWLENLNSSF
jgi:hypothetical protein